MAVRPSCFGVTALQNISTSTKFAIITLAIGIIGYLAMHFANCGNMDSLNIPFKDLNFIALLPGAILAFRKFRTLKSSDQLFLSGLILTIGFTATTLLTFFYANLGNYSLLFTSGIIFGGLLVRAGFNKSEEEMIQMSTTARTAKALGSDNASSSPVGQGSEPARAGSDSVASTTAATSSQCGGGAPPRDRRIVFQPAFRPSSGVSSIFKPPSGSSLLNHNPVEFPSASPFRPSSGTVLSSQTSVVFTPVTPALGAAQGQKGVIIFQKSAMTQVTTPFQIRGKPSTQA